MMAQTTSSTVKKRWGRKEKVGQPWPGPPLAKKNRDRNDNVHLKINIGTSKNETKPRKTAQEPPNLVDEGMQEDEGLSERPPKPPRPASLRTDMIVITVLWTWEILHNTIDALKKRFIMDIFTRAETETIDKVTDDKFILVFTLVPMLAMGTFLTFSFAMPVLGLMQKFKFWVMFLCLSVYSFSAVVGIVLAAARSTEDAIILSWLEISWYTVHPIRFWYIFHQTFPISIRWSHLLVSGNVLLIGVIEYIVTVVVKEAEHPFSSTFYVTAFSLATVAAIAWIVGTCFIKRYLNQVYGDLSSVREVYSQTEVIESFDRRQRFISIIVFLALILPAIIFPVMNVLIELGHFKLLENALSPDLGFTSYRPDLICFLLVLIIIEGVLQFLKKIRNESSDLVVIAISHLINIGVIIGLLYILYRTKDYRKRYPEDGDAIFNVNSNKDDVWFLQIGNEINKWHNRGTYVVLRNVSDDGIVTVRFANPDTGEVVFDGTVEIEVSRHFSVNAYNFLSHNSSYKLEKTPFPPVKYSYNARLFITNGLEECTDYNKTIYDLYYNPNHTRGLRVHGMCLPISLVWYERGTPQEDIKKMIPFKPPANNETSEIFEIPCVPKKNNESDSERLCNKPMTVRFWKLELYLRKVLSSIKNVAVLIRFKPYALTNLRIEEIKGDVVPDLIKGNIIQYRQEGEAILVTLMCFYGIALGLAWVGYIHFIWIQSPVRCRMLIIFSFFAIQFTASSLTKRYLTKFHENSVFTVLVFATFCFLWHVAANVLFVKRWKVTRKGEQWQQGWRRY